MPTRSPAPTAAARSAPRAAGPPAVWLALALALTLALAAGGCRCSGGGATDAAAPSDAAPTTDAAPAEDLTVWPNSVSFANSDPWIAENHETIRLMRPRVLALNFVNARTNADMTALLQQIVDGFAEGSRAHGYADPAAPVFLQYEIAYAVDLRDAVPPAGWPYNNSTLYPREDPVEGQWGFDYEQLFTAAFADLYGIADPDDPARNLTLCELVERGLVHEVWIYGDADVPDVGAAEVLEMKPAYDYYRVRIPGPMSLCAGNGCFDADDAIPPECTRSLRIGWVNDTRGPGCYLHSAGHGFEWTANTGVIPYLRPLFREFADFDLDARFGTPFDSWYACGGAAGDCLTFTSDTSVDFDTGNASGSIAPYVPVCGNVHLAPNSHNHYDDVSTATVTSSCEHYRLGDGPGGADATEPFTTDKFAVYNALAPDCGGGWQVYWRQSFPGLGNAALDGWGQPMLNWWPFLFY
jgi:hypothetical protein